MFVAKMLVSG